MGTLPEGVAGPPNPVTTASGNNWRQVEFGAVIVRNSDDTYGALNDMIYSSDAVGYVTMPNGVGQAVMGLWHNHPTRGAESQQAIDRYPSPADWSRLANVASQAGAVADPSIWLTGPDGVTREFKLSERDEFENMEREQMENGDGLDGKERSQSCG